ncbi:MAG: M48 family metallopeptidase, partial [Rhodospirillales bacterium]|nr:M48 family metallopeptidase [Rhodospirillales bacterium]
MTTAALSGCSINPATGEQSFTGFMSPADEKRIGAQEHPKILKQFSGAYKDPVITAYVNNIGNKLAQKSEMPNIGWTFTVLNSDQINAFALPGGYVYVTRGLMALAGNEAELAGVMAHEIGHVVGRHSANQLATQYGLALLSNLALGENPNEIAHLSSQLIGAGTQARFSRDDEREADKYGVKYMIGAAYAPHGLLSFFQKMNQLEKGRQSKVSNLLSSHPPTEERIQRIEKMIRNMGRP